MLPCVVVDNATLFVVFSAPGSVGISLLEFSQLPLTPVVFTELTVDCSAVASYSVDDVDVVKGALFELTVLCEEESKVEFTVDIFELDSVSFVSRLLLTFIVSRFVVSLVADVFEVLFASSVVDSLFSNIVDELPAEVFVVTLIV